MKPIGDGPLLVRVEQSTAILTLNRPEARNALNEPLLHAVDEAALDAAADPAVRALVIVGAGDRAFCAGADIRHMQGLDAEGGRRWGRLGHDVFQHLEALPIPTIAAINGVAAGGGCELALACDFRFLVAGAQMGQPEIKLGLIPGWGGTQRLPRLVGMARASELVLTGRTVDAPEAAAMGLVNEVVEGDVLARALAFAAQFAALPPLSVRYAKRAMQVGRDLPLTEASSVEVDAFSRCFETDDKTEGLAAFLEKRRPQFRGR